MPLYDITTGTGDFIANGVVSHNCFARSTHTYLDLDAGRDFEREIVVKVNVPEVLRTELAKPSWKHEQVALGTNTDPYQWVESRYKLMPEIWQALLDFDTPARWSPSRPWWCATSTFFRTRRRSGRDGLLLRADARRARLARDRAAHPLPPCAPGGSEEDERGGRAERDPYRTADARHQRLPRAGAGNPRDRRGRRRDQRSRDAAPPPAGREGRLLRVDAGAPARPDAAVRGALQRPLLRPLRRAEADRRDGRQRPPAAAQEPPAWATGGEATPSRAARRPAEAREAGRARAAHLF